MPEKLGYQPNPEDNKPVKPKKKITHKINVSKSTDAEKNKRVSLISEMLLSGLTRAEILQNITTLEKDGKLSWHVSERTIDIYIKDATVYIRSLLKDDKDILKKEIFAKYDFLYKKLVRAADYKDAGLILEKVSKLVGLNEAEKIESEITISFKES